MKNIIHKLKFITVGLIALGFTSCDAILDDEETDFGNGPDFIGFTTSAVTAPVEVDGEEHSYNAQIHLFGPGSETFGEEITVTYAIDAESTTAQEGVHYSLGGGNTVTLTPENDYSAVIPVTIFTEGLEPPVEETLTFVITEFSTSSNKDVVISDTGDELAVAISYICFADLTGTYTMTNSVCSAEVTDVTITKNDDGGWDLSTADGGLLQYCTSNTGLVNDGSIIVVCGEIRPASPSFCGSNGIGCITGGSWDAETGTLTLQHNDTFFGVGNYTSSYVRTSTATE